jgi:hypothetical protein
LKSPLINELILILKIIRQSDIKPIMRLPIKKNNSSWSSWHTLLKLVQTPNLLQCQWKCLSRPSSLTLFYIPFSYLIFYFLESAPFLPYFCSYWDHFWKKFYLTSQPENQTTHSQVQSTHFHICKKKRSLRCTLVWHNMVSSFHFPNAPFQQITNSLTQSIWITLTSILFLNFLLHWIYTILPFSSLSLVKLDSKIDKIYIRKLYYFVA